MRNWIVVALILIVIGLIGMTSSFSIEGLFSGGAENYSREETLDAADVKEIEFEVGSMDMEIVPVSSDQIRARVSGKASKKNHDNIILKLERDGDRVKVVADTNDGFSIGINIMDLDLRVELPARKWEELKLDTGSGDMDMRDIAARTIKVDGGSGDFTAEGIEADQFETVLGSGDLELQELKAANVELTVNSGNTTIDQVTASKISIQGNSGNVELIDSDAELKTRIESGNILVETDKIKHAMNLETGSGDVTISTNEQPDSARIKFTPGSGDLNNDWNNDGESLDGNGSSNITFGDGETIIQVKTGSGNLNLERR